MASAKPVSGRNRNKIWARVSEFLTQCQRSCEKARPWQRVLLAMALGGSAVLAFPPVHFVPALVPAFVGLTWLVSGSRTWRGAAAVGWCFGFGYFCAGLYWIANALLTKPDEFGALIPLAVGGLSALLSLFIAFAAGLAATTRAKGWPLVLALAGAWTIAEWMRSFVLTGFPWNLIASVWAFSEYMLQFSALVGPYGLGLITVAAAAMPAALVMRGSNGGASSIAVLAVFVLLALVGVGGAIRLHMVGPPTFVGGVQLRLVQPNIPQTLKWRPDLRIKHIEDQIELAMTASPIPPTHVVWPEVAAPLFIEDYPALLQAIGGSKPQGALTLLGSLRRQKGEHSTSLWNSLFVVGTDGRVLTSYDKVNLVPFGEYVPFRDILGIDGVAGGAIDFTPGLTLETLTLPSTPPVSPLICYEVIFPRAVYQEGRRPNWLVNITNDAWYGYSAGPFQHFAAARMRAVEEGLPLVRVANTGISAIIDPYGRVIQSLGLERRGIVDGPLPSAAPSTPYSWYGNSVPIALAVIFLALTLAVQKTRRLWRFSRNKTD